MFKIFKKNPQNNLLKDVNDATEKVKFKLLNSHIKSYLEAEKNFMQKMEIDFKRLLERFKDEENKKNQIMEDWRDYLNIISEIIHAREILYADIDEEAQDKFEARTNSQNIKRREIECRFKDLLGKDYIDPTEMHR